MHTAPGKLSLIPKIQPHAMKSHLPPEKEGDELPRFSSWGREDGIRSSSRLCINPSRPFLPRDDNQFFVGYYLVSDTGVAWYDSFSGFLLPDIHRYSRREVIVYTPFFLSFSFCE